MACKALFGGLMDIIFTEEGGPGSESRSREGEEEVKRASEGSRREEHQAEEDPFACAQHRRRTVTHKA